MGLFLLGGYNIRKHVSATTRTSIASTNYAGPHTWKITRLKSPDNAFGSCWIIAAKSAFRVKEVDFRAYLVRVHDHAHGGHSENRLPKWHDRDPSPFPGA